MTLAALVKTNGKIQTLSGKAEPDEGVPVDDVKDDTKLARLLTRVLKELAELKRRFSPRRTDFEDLAVGAGGALTRLAHGFAGRARWSVVGWKTNATPLTDNALNYATTWLMRGLWGPFALSSNAGSFTTGMRFRATAACQVTGARFLWSASTRTVKVTLWRDSDGAVLGTGTVACVNSGVYAVTFASPVTLAGADLNVNLTLGVRDMAGTAYTACANDAQFRALLPLTLPGFTLTNVDLFLAGDARPTSTAGTTQYYVEPVLTPAEPYFTEDASTDGNTLVLKSYAPGTATLRVEAVE